MTDEQLRLYAAVTKLPHAKMEPLCYLEADRDGIVDYFDSFCPAHARIVAAWTARESGVDVYVCRAWADSDRCERCGFGSCGVPLRPDGGGLTDWGIRDALALTEEDPYASSVSPQELILSAGSIWPHDSPHWTVWERQARRVLAEAGANAERRTSGRETASSDRDAQRTRSAEAAATAAVAAT